MTERTVRYAATDEALLAHALAPTMRWLIATALDKTKMTYGDVKRRLEDEEGFSTIFATRIGLVAGELMNLIHSVDPKAPLINVLVVNQKDELPSKGAGSFMATRFENSRLSIKNYKQLYPAKWRTYFDRAAAEVYAYSPEAWAKLYEAVFEERLPQETIEAEREKRQEGNEDDFDIGAGKYGAGGEGVHHRALRLWVTNNPDKVGRGYPRARTETEYNLDSGDRVDSVFHLADRTIALEVKSRISNFVDLKRGVFQCIKYRAVMTAMDVRTEVPVEAVLVTETKLPGEILALLRHHGIRHFQAPLERLA